jgi:hypothetical protein
LELYSIGGVFGRGSCSCLSEFFGFCYDEEQGKIKFSIPRPRSFHPDANHTNHIIIQISALDVANNQLTSTVEDLAEKVSYLAKRMESLHQSLHLDNADSETCSTNGDASSSTSLRDSIDGSDPLLPTVHSSNNLHSRSRAVSGASATIVATLGGMPPINTAAANVAPRSPSPSHKALTPTASAAVAAAATKAPAPTSTSSAASAGTEGAGNEEKDLVCHSVTPTPNDALPSSPYLSTNLFAEIPAEEGFNQAVNDILVALQPQPAQLQYRDSVLTVLRKTIREALNCEAMEVGLHRLLCYLPDDPLKVSAMICRNHSTKWHRMLCDRLNLIAKKKADDAAALDAGGYHDGGGFGGGGGGAGYHGQHGHHAAYGNQHQHQHHHPYNGNGNGSHHPGEEHANNSHVFRNVVISNNKLNIQVQCIADNMEVELSCNSRADVCMLALLEDISILVGKNDLFKQSMMLIRAWWCYECGSYVGATIKYYLSDFSLCIMIAAVFNQYHASINSPFQALCVFLAEYSSYDGNVSAITLQGIVPFKSASSNQPMLRIHCPGEQNGSSHTAQQQQQSTSNSRSKASSNAPQPLLCSNEMIEQYWLIYCPPDSTNPEQQQKIVSLKSASSDDNLEGTNAREISNMRRRGDSAGGPDGDNQSDIDEGEGATGGSSSAGSEINKLGHNGGSSSLPATTSPQDAALSAHYQSCMRNLAKFDRSLFNIVDPFTCNNMVLERPSANRIGRLTKVFQASASTMASILKRSEKQQEAAEPVVAALDCRALVRSFFPFVTERFVESAWRSDTFHPDANAHLLTHLTR